MLGKCLFVIYCICVTSRISVVSEYVVHPDCIDGESCTNTPPEAEEQRIFGTDSEQYPDDLIGNSDNCYEVEKTIQILPATNVSMWNPVVGDKYFGQNVTEITCGHEDRKCLQSLSLDQTTRCATVYGTIYVVIEAGDSKNGAQITNRTIGVGCVCKIFPP